MGTELDLFLNDYKERLPYVGAMDLLVAYEAFKSGDEAKTKKIMSHGGWIGTESEKTDPA